VASSAAERAARAGWGLGAASIHWGKRPAEPRPVAVTERDCGLLALLHDVNYLSASQIAMLGWGGDSSCARRRLRLLHDRGLIDKFRPAAAAGSYEWNYRLTVAGWRLLDGRGLCAEEKPYAPADLHSIAYVEHDLQVMLYALPFQWHGPRRGEIAPSQEQQQPGGCPLRSSLPPVFLPAGSREGVLKPARP
jgi:Replication-relaxation